MLLIFDVMPEVLNRASRAFLGCESFRLASRLLTAGMTNYGALLMTPLSSCEW